MSRANNAIDVMTELISKASEYSPEIIAWQLLFGDIDKNDENIFAVIPPDNEDCDVTFLYEILITIFMEMIFNLAKTMEGNFDDYVPDYDNFDFDLFCDTINDKFSMLKYLPSIKKNDLSDYSENKDELKKIYDDRYCRVVLRYNDSDDHFENNNVDDEVYYHMKLNGLNNKEYKSISDVYSIVFLNEKIYRISFNKI